jgi:hypothetical protein
LVEFVEASFIFGGDGGVFEVKSGTLKCLLDGEEAVVEVKAECVQYLLPFAADVLQTRIFDFCKIARAMATR